MVLKIKFSTIIIVVIALCVTVLSGVFIYQSVTEEYLIDVNNSSLVISGKYNTTLDLKEAELSFSEDAIKPTLRVSGISNENELNGTYRVEGFEDKVYLAIKNMDIPYVIIKNEDGIYLINKETLEETKELFLIISNQTN